MVKGQRTKGNTKPSSSRRTAELLASSAMGGTEAVNAFIGFSSVSANPDNTGADEEDLSIDPEFKVLFKKMSKKDCITKVKALQEFQQLIKDKTEPEVKCTLSQWPRIYNKLANDNDWRVREATHRSQEQLVIKVGRNIAPHLKQLLPVWLTSHFDCYSPAATAAVSSFQTAFPATKKSDVLLFTKDSIINYIKDMLLNQTVETVGELSSTAEENKSKYNRLISNCLQGLSALIAAIPTDSLPDCEKSLQDLVNNNKFWKFAKFPDSSIRSSWFRLMSTFGQYIPQLFILNANKICGLTLGALDVYDILVAGAVWECALLAVITIDNCWKHVNFRKAFYPQFRSVLREGGRGNACALFPNLLPLLSRIPHESTEEFIRFHNEFYAFLREGIEKTVTRSQKECNAVIKAYMECMRYSISNTTIEDIEQRTEFRTKLIQNELLVLINDSITANDSLSKSLLFTDLGLLWLYLQKGDNYQNLSQLLGNRLKEICLSKIAENDFKAFPRISRLILCLFSDSNAIKKDKKIRFRRESDEEVQKSLQNLKFNDLISDPTAADVVNQITKSLIEAYHSDYHKYKCLELLSNLLRVQNTNTFKSLLNCLNLQNLDQFWTNFLKVWFKTQSLSLQSNEKTKQINVLIDLIVILLPLIEDKERKFHLLNEVSSLTDPYIIEPLFSTIIESNNKDMLEWLKSENAGTAIVTQTSLLIHSSIERTGVSSQTDLDILWKLMSLCFSNNSFAKHYIETIIDNFRISLQNTSRLAVTNTDTLVEFTCRLAEQLFSSYELCTSLSSARDLLLTIFTINCRFDDPNKQLMNAWKSGVKNIVKSNGAYLSEDGIITKLALQIRFRLQSNITSIENAEQVYKCGFELINTIYETINSGISEDVSDEKRTILLDPNISLILDLMLLTNSEWNELSAKCDYSVIHYDWLSNDTLFDLEKCQMIAETSFPTNCIPFVFSAVSTTLLIEKLIQNQSTIRLNDNLCEVIVNQLKHLFIASAYVSVKSRTTNKTISFRAIGTVLSESLSNILELTTSDKLDVKLGQLLLEESIQTNAYNSKAFSYFMDNFMQKDRELQYQLSFENLNYNKIITFQKHSSHLPQNKLNELLVQSMNAFICCEKFIQLDDGIAKLAVLQTCLKYSNTAEDNETIAETVTSIMETFCGLKASNSDLFYYKNDIEADYDSQFYSLIIQTFDVIVAKYSVLLSQSHWDLILCSTTSWIINIIRQKENFSNNLLLNIFAIKVLNLIQTISQTFDAINKSDSSGKYPLNLLEEWHEFHSKNIFMVLIPFFVEMIEKVNFYSEILLKFLSKTIVSIPDSVINDLLTNLQNKDSLSVQPIDKHYESLYLPQEKENCFNQFCPLVLNHNLPIAISSHKLVLKFIPFLLKDVIQPDVVSQEEEETLLSPPKTLLSLLQQTDHIVDTMLSEFLIGDTVCVVEPQTDSFTYTFAYLLLWIEIIDIFGNICDETRSQFAAFLRQSSYLSRLLENLFRLMPLSATDSQTLTTDLLINSDSSIQTLLSIDSDLNSQDIQRLSCHLYYLILRRLPASVRQWWNNCDRKTSEVVNRYTSSYFSGVLCAQELEAVQKADISKFKNMTVKARPSAREVLAIYTIEEITIELLVQLPPNHPLGPVSIDSGKRVGVNGAQWRTWLLQLTTFLTHQNGSILDGLILWKRNIDKRFEGIEECMICFYVLHGSTFQLPKLQCKYCKKRYHSPCLYKWFNTSNNSTCPLCRNLF